MWSTFSDDSRFSLFFWSYVRLTIFTNPLYSYSELLEDCRDERHRLKEKRARLEKFRASLVDAESDSAASPAPAPAPEPVASSEAAPPKKSKKRKSEEVETTPAKSAETSAVDGKKNKKVKAKKDPNLPKRAPTAYTLFVQDKQGSMKAAHPELAQKELMAHFGVAWKALSDADKAPFEKQAAEKKEQYKVAMESYKSTQGGAASADSD